MNKLIAFWKLFSQTIKDWQKDKASQIAAALALYAVLSIPPLLVLATAIAGQFVEEQAVQQALLGQVRQSMGAQGEEVITAVMDAATRPQGLSLATAVSIILLLLGASGVFLQLQDAMNTIWDVMPDPNRGFLSTLKKRGLSFAMVIGVGALLLILLIANAIIANLDQILTAVLPSTFQWAKLLNFLVSIIIITGLFALVLKVIPDVKISWRDVWVGAVVTAVLFMIGVFGIGLYFQYSNPTSAYGAAGALLILLLWIYYSAQIFLLGAEFTQVYANQYGGHITPDEGAVWLPQAQIPSA
jgi:membrane protein